MPPIPIQKFEARLPALVDMLHRFVGLESPTTQKPAVDAFGVAVAEEMKRQGAEVERRPQHSVGDIWIGRWGAGEGGLLLLTHLDKVHALGTPGTFPFPVREGA